VSTIAAPRPGDAPPVSYLNAWWGVAQCLLVGLIVVTIAAFPLMMVGYAVGLPLGPPGGSEAPLASPSALLGWPFDPSLLWFRLVDVLALASVTLWLGRRLRDRFLILGIRLRLADALLSVSGLMIIAAMSHWAGLVASFVIAGLLRRAGNSRAPSAHAAHRRWGRWIAGAWAVAILGSLVAINFVPVGAAAGAACSTSGGTVQPPPNTSFGAGQPPISYPFQHGGTFTSCAVTQNRAWFARATVLGIDPNQLASGPWHVALVRNNDSAPGFGFRRIAPFSLAPHSSRDVFVLVRFTSCGLAMRGRTFTLTNLPLRVRAYGRTQTDPVPLQSVRTTCP
jgi:hypothetical protein